jgi:hypothetical protein
MKNVSDKSCRENQNTHIALYIYIYIYIYIFEYRAVYKIEWKNIVGAGRLQMTMWRMRIAYWIPKATNTHIQVM